jgi:hypothetical protein
MNSVFIHQAKHPGFLLLIKAISRDIVDQCLGKPYFNDGTMIPKADGEIIIRALPVGPHIN